MSSDAYQRLRAAPGKTATAKSTVLPPSATATGHARLWVVATPIGNREDLSARALRVLAEADAIVCEDTRHSGQLLAGFGIHKPLISFYEENERQRLPELLSRLEAGESLALISDAGTPAIADPGYRLVAAAAAAGCAVVPIPGASAALAALMASGLPTDSFTFLGFLPPRSAARRQRLRELAGRRETLICFEAPHRLAACLADMAAEWGAARPLAVGRELTKLHEEMQRGSLGVLAAHWRERQPRGEFTLVVAGAAVDAVKVGLAAPLASSGAAAGATPEALAVARIRELLAGGLEQRAALKQAARESGLPRSRLYREWTLQRPQIAALPAEAAPGGGAGRKR